MADLTEQQLLSTDPDVLGLQRQRKLAELLTGQAFNQPQGQMISGRYVAPSGLQQALPMISAAIGGLSNANLDTKQTELAAALRGKQQQAVQQYMDAKTPKEQFIAGTNQYAPSQLQSAAYEMLKPTVLAPESSIVKPSFGAEGGYQTMATGPEKKSDAIRGYALAKSQGYTGSFLEYETGLKRAGASHFNFTDILGKDIGQVKDLLTASQTRVQAGEMSMNAANKIDQAIKSGNLNVGPGATVGQYMGQVGDALGLVNEKGQDKLVNTRAAIQGLAQMWATSRTQGKGQGAMDQQESQLYGKISSGEIDKISIPELKYMVEQTKSQGNFFRQEHTRMLNELKKDDKLKNIVPFYEVGYMPTPPGNPNASGGSGGVKLISIESK